MMEQYKHPFTAVIGEEARRKNMPNEMNYIMDYRLCLLYTSAFGYIPEIIEFTKRTSII